jgi:exonuclease III
MAESGKGGRRFIKPKKEGVAILISEKVEFKLTLIKRDKEGHSILIKEEIHQKEITIINLYAPNTNAPNFTNHTLKDLKTYINSNTVVVGEHNIPLLPIDRLSKQKMNEEILELNHIIDQMDLADVYRIFHPTLHNIHSSQQSMEPSPKLIIC